jgi:hypothetical protein
MGILTQRDGEKTEHTESLNYAMNFFFCMVAGSFSSHVHLFSIYHLLPLFLLTSCTIFAVNRDSSTNATTIAIQIKTE